MVSYLAGWSMTMSSTLGPAAALVLPQKQAQPALPDGTVANPASLSSAADSGAMRHGILEVPRLVAGKTSPKFSLVVVLLSRAPVAGEDSIRPLLMSAYLVLLCHKFSR